MGSLRTRREALFDTNFSSLIFLLFGAALEIRLFFLIWADSFSSPEIVARRQPDIKKEASL